MTEYLTRIQERLAGVVIENKDVEDLIKVYDKPEAFLYLDPPYHGTEKYYQAQFSQDDHIRLSKVLGRVKGKFLLSYNDCEFVRELYREYSIHEVTRNHNLVNKYNGKDNTYAD